MAPVPALTRPTTSARLPRMVSISVHRRPISSLPWSAMLCVRSLAAMWAAAVWAMAKPFFSRASSARASSTEGSTSSTAASAKIHSASS